MQACLRAFEIFLKKNLARERLKRQYLANSSFAGMAEW